MGSRQKLGSWGLASARTRYLRGRRLSERQTQNAYVPNGFTDGSSPLSSPHFVTVFLPLPLPLSPLPPSLFFPTLPQKRGGTSIPQALSSNIAPREMKKEREKGRDRDKKQKNAWSVEGKPTGHGDMKPPR